MLLRSFRLSTHTQEAPATVDSYDVTDDPRLVWKVLSAAIDKLNINRP